MVQILYGKNSVLEVCKSGRRKIFEVYVSGKKNTDTEKDLISILKSKSIPIKTVERHHLDHLTQGARHQGIAAKVSDYPYSTLEAMVKKNEDQALFLACDSIKDPQNFGTLCRSAFCFGVHGILLNKDRSVEITPSVISASAGAAEHLDIAKVTNLSQTLLRLKEQDFWSYAADASAKDTLETLTPSKKMVVVLGSEGEGIRPLVLKTCDFRFSIPMVRSFDSLNVAQAASVVLYVLSR